MKCIHEASIPSNNSVCLMSEEMPHGHGQNVNHIGESHKQAYGADTKDWDGDEF